MTSEVNSLFYPLGIWSLLYVILSWIIQCAIAIYGNFYASIPQLAKYEPEHFSAAHLNWVVSCVSISIHVCLASALILGISVKKYKNKPFTRLVDWILVLTALNCVASICNGLSIWGYGLRGWRTIHHLLIFDRPCCFAGSVWVVRNQGASDKSHAPQQLSCVCRDFTECFTDQQSSECSQIIESRIAVYCCLLQILQYVTTVFMVVEIVLILHAAGMVCKSNYESPINTYRLKTYNEYKTVTDSLKQQNLLMQQARTGGARTSFESNARDSVSYSLTEPCSREVRRTSLEYIIESSEQDEGSTSMNQEAFEGMRCLENSMAVASGVPEVNMTELEIHAATGATNTSSSGVAGTGQLDFSASGGSAELRNYFRHFSVGDVDTVASEHLTEPLFRSNASNAKSLGRMKVTDGPFETSQRLASTTINGLGEAGVGSGVAESDNANNLLSGSLNGNPRRTFRSRTSILDLIKQGEQIPRVSLHSLPRNLNSNVCTKCAAHHKNHRHNRPGDIHNNKTHVTDTRDYKETKRRELESARKTAVGKK